MIERLALMSGVIAITGDINIRLDRPTDPHCVQFNEPLDSFGLQQLVVQPTHRLGEILDVVITQGGFTGPIPEVRDVGLSDHSCILWLLNVSRPAPVYNRIECRNWKSFNIDSFRNDPSLSALCVPSINLLNTAATMTSMYDVTLSDLLNHNATMKTMLVRDHLICGLTTNVVRQRFVCVRSSDSFRHQMIRLTERLDWRSQNSSQSLQFKESRCYRR